MCEDVRGRLNTLGKAKSEKQRLAIASEVAALVDGRYGWKSSRMQFSEYTCVRPERFVNLPDVAATSCPEFIPFAFRSGPAKAPAQLHGLAESNSGP